VRELALKQPMAERSDTYAAIRSTLALLDDPFTRFLEPERYAVLKRGNSGTLSGVGLEIGFDSAGGAGGELVVRLGGWADRQTDRGHWRRRQ
jgi:carboxyl-terminal processing protease